MEDFDGGFSNFEIFCKKFDKGGVGFAIVRFGTKVDDEFVIRDLDDFFLAATGFDDDLKFHNSSSLRLAAMIETRPAAPIEIAAAKIAAS